MNQITIKRAVGLAAALCMMFVLILGSLPVRAAGTLKATATAASGSLESGVSTAIQVDFVHEEWTGKAPSSVSITVTPNAGLTGSCEPLSATPTKNDEKSTLTYSILIPKDKFTYNGVNNAGLTFEVTYDSEDKYTAVAQVSADKVPDDDGGDSGPVTPSTPTGNLIGVKPGTALPSIKAGESKTIEIPLTGTSSNSRYAGKTQITAQLPEGIYFNTATAMQELNFSSRSKEQTLKLPISADSEAKSGVFPITLEAIYKYSGQQIKETIQINLKVEGKTETEASSGLSIKGYQGRVQVLSAAKMGSDWSVNDSQDTFSYTVDGVQYQLDLTTRQVTQRSGS